MRWIVALAVAVATAFGACAVDRVAKRVALPDASPADAAADRGLPVVRDDSEEFDAGYDPFAGEWRYLPGNPVNCKVRIAEDPAASVTPLKWEPCKSRASCRRLVVDWWSYPYDALRFDYVEPVRLVNGKPYVSLWKQYPDPQSSVDKIAIIFVVMPMDGAAVFAAGIFTPPGSQYCPFATTYGSDGIGLHALPRPSRSWDFFGWSRWESPAAVDGLTIPHVEVPCDICQSLASSRRSLACGCDYPPYAILFDEERRQVILPGSPGPILEGWPIWPAVNDGFISYNSSALPYSFDLVHRDGTHAKLLRPSANKAGWIGVDRSDSERLAWVEVAGEGFGPFTDGVLWTAPYAAQESNLARRKVARLPTITNRGARRMVVNGGLTLQTVTSRTALLTRLSDGWSWSIDAEPEDEYHRALWVDDKEVWLAVEAAASNHRVWSIVRIERGSLGAPTIGPGL